MFYPDEIRRSEDIVSGLADIVLRPNELRMAQQLVDAMTESFKAEAHEDEYRKALIRLVESKVSGAKVEVEPTAQPEEPKSLIEALKASVETAKAKGRATA